jgi:putative ABC transport system permease protein
MLADLRLAVLALRRHPVFAGTCIGILAVGLGGAIVLFAALDATLLQPLPYARPHEIFTLRTQEADESFSNGLLARIDLARLDEAGGALLGAVGAAPRTDVLIRPGADPVLVNVTRVTEGFVDFFGLPLHLGRSIHRDEHVGGNRSGVLSYGLWSGAYGADPGVIGSTLRLDDSGQAAIVGVAPPSFRIPEGTDVWLAESSRPIETSRSFEAFVRAARFGSPDLVRSQVEAVLEQVRHEVPRWSPRRALISPLQEEILGETRPMLVVSAAAAGLLLLLGCSNVACLLLIRRVSRVDELATHVALGSTPWRAVRQALFESATLTVMAGVFGIVMAIAGIRLFLVTGSTIVPELAVPTANVRLVAAALLFLLATSLVVAAPPAISLIRQLATPGVWGVWETSFRRPRASALDVMVGAGVALAVLVAAGAGWLVSSFQALQRRDLGFVADGRLVADISLPRTQYNREARAPWFSELAEAVRALPNVRAVGYAATVPLRSERDTTWGSDVILASGETSPRTAMRLRYVSPEFFDAMGIALVHGRDFLATDHYRSAVIVNLTVADRYFTSGRYDAYGIVTLGLDRRTLPRGVPIVGVVADARYGSLMGDVEPTIYLPGLRPPGSRQTLAVAAEQTRLPELALRVKAIISSLEPEAVVTWQTMTDVVDAHLARRRLGMLVMLVFAVTASVLAAAGSYALAALGAAQRRHELAMRLVLGGDRRDLAWLLVRRLGGSTIVGSLAGLGAAVAAGRLVTSRIPFVQDADPVVVALSIGGVGLAIGLATLVPVLRATTVDVPAMLRQ